MFQRVREANRTVVPEHSVALRVAVFVAVMIATLGALDLGVGGPAVAVACVTGVPAGYVISYLLRNRSRGWLKAILAVAAITAFVQFVGLFAPALGGQVLGLQTGLVELLLWVQVLHSMDLPARRDLLFSLATSGALLIVTATLATSDRFGLVVLLWLAAAMAALAIANLNDVGLTTRRLRRTRSIPGALVAVSAAALLLFAVLPPARVFSFGLPSRAVAGGVTTGGRLVNPAFNGLPSASGRGATSGFGTFGYYGYTDSLDLGFRGRPDNTVVMRVRAPGPDFWRAQTFDRFDGRRWSNSDTKLRPVFETSRGLIPLTPPEDRPMLNGDDFIQTFYIGKMAPNMVFAAATPMRVYWPFDQAYQLSDGTLRGGDTLAPGTVYSVVSRRLPVTPALLRAHNPTPFNLDPATLRRYTALPAIAARVRTLATDLAATSPSAYDTIQAMTDWIATHTKYSLNPPRLRGGEDAVEQFLFEDQRGFCEQIASSLVVMLRAAGVPARLTVGYAPGKRNPFSGLYEVRASDAHSYAEVLFPGVGWQAFDPTADVPLAGEAAAFPASAAAGLSKWVADRLPTQEQATAAAAVVIVLATSVWTLRMVRRRLARTWLEAQLSKLERQAGVPIEHSATLPAWLARLPDAERPRYERIVAALEREAWSPEPLDDDTRRSVEHALGR